MPDGLTLADILAATQPAANVLVARGRPLGMPLGLGLSVAGGLAGVLQQRNLLKKQNLAIINALQQSNPAAAKSLQPIADQGGDVLAAFKALFPQQKPNLVAFNPKTGEERRLGPNEPIPDGFVTSSFYQKPHQATATGAEGVAAAEVGAGTDPTKWTKEQAAEIARRAASNRLAGERPEKPDKPTVVFGPDGKPYSIDPTELPPLPSGSTASKTAPKPKSGSTKEWTPKDALQAYNEADKAARTKLTKPGMLWGKTTPSEDDVAKERTARLNRLGLDADGNRLTTGASTTITRP